MKNKLKHKIVFALLVMFFGLSINAQTSPVKLGELMVNVDRGGVRFINDSTTTIDSTVNITIIFMTTSPKELQNYKLAFGTKKEERDMYDGVIKIVNAGGYAIDYCEPIVLNGGVTCKSVKNKYDAYNFVNIQLTCTRHFFEQCKWLSIYANDNYGKTTVKKYFQLNL